MKRDVTIYLAQQGVTVEQYLAWLETKYWKIFRLTSAIIASSLAAFFIWFGINTYQKEGPQTPVGLLIGFVSVLELAIVLPIFWIGVLRPKTEIKSQPLAENLKSQMASSYIAHYCQIDQIKKITPETWEKIKNQKM